MEHANVAYDVEMTKACALLHKRLGELPRFSGFVLPEALPADGVYVVFDSGEDAHGGARIVRIGTHRGAGKLRSRLKEHCTEPGRSIFRKHIGRCLLASSPDKLANWELRSVARADWDRNNNLIDWDMRKKVHVRISDYIRTKLEFACIAVPDNRKRHLIEKAMLSTIAQCRECGPSGRWLGLRHPRAKIRESGLWNVQGMRGVPMSPRDVAQLNFGQARGRSD